MMIISKKAIARRTVLRGLGATIALPLLDSMTPALSAATKPARRLAVIYQPNGMNMAEWTPAEGTWTNAPSLLRPLADFHDRLLTVSGLRSGVAFAREGEGGGSHSRSMATYLTGVHPKKTEGSDIRAGISMDQIAANEFKTQTQLASLELALEPVDLVGSCDIGYSCAYTGTVSWRSPTTPLPMEVDPRAVFERLFGASDSTDPRVRLARIQKDRSILDSVTADMARFQKQLGARDRAKVNEYVEAVRDIERRIQLAEEQSGEELTAVDRPAGIPGTFEEHAKLMFDLLALAFESDLTRISTFMMGREISTRTFPEIGVPEAHHPVSHHANNPQQLEKQAKIDTLHMVLFAHLLEKMKATADGDGSLLDHTLIMYGCGMSDSNVHLPDNLPTLIVGGKSNGLKGHHHVKYAEGTPFANLHVALLDKMGIRVEQFGESTAMLNLPSA